MVPTALVGYLARKNVVMNYTEMEVKVNEATNGDAWGASSTLMKDISSATHNFQNFNEIMPCIYKRFTESEAHQWRQIYKALTLLEYLVKNGSERVVDDIKGHLSTIKMLRSFHYVDEQGKDQGINVRQRSKELTDLVQNSARVREERAKAKANRHKYTGVSSTSGRYGGFGSNSAGSSSYNDFQNSTRYDEDDYQRSVSSRTSPTSRDTPSSTTSRAPRTRTNGEASRQHVVSPPLPPEPQPDLLSLDDNFTDSPAAHTVPPTSVSTAPTPSFSMGSATLADDDWGDFQSTEPAPTTAATFTGTRVSLHAPVGSHRLPGDRPPADLLAQGMDLLSMGDSGGAGAPPATAGFGSFVTPSVAPITRSGSSPNIAGLRKGTQMATAVADGQEVSPKNDIWSANSSLVSLDLLGSNKKTTKGPAKQSMHSLATMQAKNRLEGNTASPARTPVAGLSGWPAAAAGSAPSHVAKPAANPLSKNDLDLFL
ncbi:Epsin-3, clathrin recruitment and traffic between the Golgi and endosome [Tieghemiomyces parasiticus]|uniref:Epsin-3, clathrin recruitment and traffic between the Golgi and endosome n=1 Tax=Tieghemiomyces parasiticus TaxID=78921 RepID=A0A9W7ZMZ5_9FUNG|nr:Epsin-3, clathrin recruitment and traffic between the Golgi and endosome [Tieghemiomyces parasiticus]